MYIRSNRAADLQKQLLGSTQLGLPLRRLVVAVPREVAVSLSNRSVAVHATARFLNECAQPVNRSHVIRSQSWQEFFRLVHLLVRLDARLFTEPVPELIKSKFREMVEPLREGPWLLSSLPLAYGISEHGFTGAHRQ